jgi:hypothetical protein
LGHAGIAAAGVHQNKASEATDGGKAVEGNVSNEGSGRGRRWRIAVWALAALFLLLPLVVMQFSAEVNWDVADFAFAGALLLGAGVALELVVRTTGNRSYRAATGLAVAAAFLLVWLSLGVGIIGKDGDPANLMYFGVLAVGFIVAGNARFRAAGMARALLATALAQALVAAIALVAGLGLPWSGPVEIVLLNGIFVALFAGSALLFRKAAREQGAAGRAKGR